MKKKILSICLAIALAVSAICVLTACGGQGNYYYTIETPQNCTFWVFSSASDKRGTFVNKGSVFEGQVEITPGYEVSGELVIKVNGEIADWTDSGENDQYAFSFTPTEDFNIKIEGTIVESSYEVNFVKQDDADVSGLYIRFEGEAEKPLAEFLSTPEATQNFKYNDSLQFYVYTKGYTAEPLVAGLYMIGSFYKNETNDEYGYFYSGEVVEDFDIEFYGTMSSDCYIACDASASEVRSSIYSEKLEISASGGILTVVFGDDVPQETISQLTLTVNGEEQDVSLKSGKNEIKLKRAYEYVSADGIEYSPYRCTIDLNFYDFAVFDGILDE